MNVSTVVPMPRVRRGDVAAVFVSTAHVPDAGIGRRRIMDAYGAYAAAGPLPGLLSLSCFLSVDSTTVLSYVQCADPDAYDGFALAARGGLGGTAVRYARGRGVVLHDGVRPGCVVVATFDVDGPESQTRIVDGICDAIEAAPRAQHPGLLAANFHLSADGSRVLNYAEWTCDADHEAFLAGATRATAVRVTGETPGVRPIGFTRYHLVS